MNNLVTTDCETLGSKPGEGVFSHDYLGPRMGQSGMAFWCYDEIPLWASLGALAEAA